MVFHLLFNWVSLYLGNGQLLADFVFNVTSTEFVIHSMSNATLVPYLRTLRDRSLSITCGKDIPLSNQASSLSPRSKHGDMIRYTARQNHSFTSTLLL